LNEDFSVFLDRVKALDVPATFIGDGCLVHGETIKKSGFSIAPYNILLQRASSVGLLALGRASKGMCVDYNDLELIYLRKPQAEREYEERQ